MRFLERTGTGKLSLPKDFHGSEILLYAILSHIWGTDESIFSIEERMSWAEHRQTKLEEDKSLPFGNFRYSCSCSSHSSHSWLID